MNGSGHDPWYCKKCKRDNMPQSNTPGEGEQEWKDRLSVGFCRSCWIEHKNLGTELSARLRRDIGRQRRLLRVLTLVAVLGWLVAVVVFTAMYGSR